MQLTPTSEAELAEIVRGADNPLFIRGGGTRGILGDGVVLNTTRLNGITLYEPGALTMVAGAGTPLAQIEAALETEGQMLAFEPFTFGAEGEPTIGGVKVRLTSAHGVELENQGNGGNVDDKILNS